MALHLVSVQPNIYVGSILALTSPVTLESRRVAAVVSLVSGPLPAAYQATLDRVKTRICHLHVDVEDEENVNILQYIELINAFIDDTTAAIDSENGPSVLIHCMAGISRSATVAIAYLMWKHQLDYETVFKSVKSQRTVISPNPAFVAQLRLYEQWQWVITGNPLYKLWLSDRIPRGSKVPLDVINSRYAKLKL
ncbi:phosphatases II [Nadsonia fulvescens var. elongata DSM 6958]|uniref:protein-tyrosine-phosphatase n=1 Tax=Nadsonia fulvescens var. elongata DSM 6958 TaxID=857566 RepID=A0A1E3PCG2_9ASCO|nr:phosphatases II [Nadsonia fulvescens var. elongata DSM 6958]